MKRNKLLIICMTLFLVLLGACGNGEGGADAENGESLVLKSGVVVGDWAPQYEALSTLKEVVEENSDSLTIEEYPDGTLGGEREMLEGVQQGTLEIGLLSSAVYAAFDENLTAIDIPYLVSNFEEAEEMMDGPVGEKMNEMFEEIGIKVLAWGHNDFRIISNDVRPIERPEDLNGIQMRVAESQILTEWYSDLGALTTNLPFPDIYNALQQGVADGQDNGPILTFASNFTDHQDYVTVTNHQYSPIGFFINLDLWNSMSEEQQNVLNEAAEEAALVEREAIKTFNETVFNEMEEDGVEVNRLSDDELAEWVETGREAAEKLSSGNNPLLDIVLEEVDF